MSARGSGVVQTGLAPGKPGPLPGSPPDVEPRPRRSARKRKEIATAYTMLIPSLIGVGFFLMVPIALVIAISFVNWNLISAPTFVGLDNYEAMFVSPGFWNSVKVTIIFSLIAIPAAVMIGLLIAVGLNRKLPGSGILQILYVIPWVAAPLSLGIVWSWLLAPSGLINELLGTRVSWLASESTALPVVAFVYVWQNVGYISLFFLAALQSIPRDIYEAASWTVPELSARCGRSRCRWFAPPPFSSRSRPSSRRFRFSIWSTASRTVTPATPAARRT